MTSLQLGDRSWGRLGSAWLQQRRRIGLELEDSGDTGSHRLCYPYPDSDTYPHYQEAGRNTSRQSEHLLLGEILHLLQALLTNHLPRSFLLSTFCQSLVFVPSTFLLPQFFQGVSYTPSNRDHDHEHLRCEGSTPNSRAISWSRSPQG